MENPFLIYIYFFKESLLKNPLRNAKNKNGSPTNKIKKLAVGNKQIKIYTTPYKRTRMYRTCRLFYVV